MTGTTKLYLLMGGIVLASLAGYTWFMYNWGHGDGVMEQQLAYATAKPKIDTVRTVEYRDRPVYRERKVPFYVRDPRADSLIASLADKDSLIRVLSEKASATFTEPELGVLAVDYIPLDRYFEIDHQPPPAKIERIQITVEKPILLSPGFWDKIEYSVYGGVVVAAAFLLLER